MNSKDIIQTLNSRYSTKIYDNTKKISEADIETITESFRLSPSSLGLQPWHLFVISNQDIKEKLAEVTLGHNVDRIKNCSHLLVIAHQTKLSDDYFNQYIKSLKEARGETRFTLEIFKDFIKNLKNEESYYINQCYIAAGFMEYTAALLGINSTIMAGINPKGYDEVLKLGAKGLNTVLAFALGHASDKEKPSDRIKVRFPKNQVVTRLQ